MARSTIRASSRDPGVRMSGHSNHSGRRSRRPRRASIGMQAEVLERRGLRAGANLVGMVATILETEPNDTVDVAQDLDVLQDSRPLGVLATIGGGTSGAADVDWYQFTLD